jgi:nucleolar complex protein 2
MVMARKRPRQIPSKARPKPAKKAKKPSVVKDEAEKDREDDLPLGEQSVEQFLSGWEDEATAERSDNDTDDETEEEASSGDEDDDERSQAAFIASLKDKDPEFYKFLQENDRQLLKGEDEDEDEGDEENRIHRPPQSLEVASDESDFEEEEEEEEARSEELAKAKGKGKASSKVKVKKPFLDDLEQRLQQSPSPAAINDLADVFR